MIESERCNMCRRTIYDDDSHGGIVTLTVHVKDTTCRPNFIGEGDVEIKICKSCFDRYYREQAIMGGESVRVYESGPLISHNSEKVNKNVLGRIIDDFLRWLNT